MTAPRDHGQDRRQDHGRDGPVYGEGRERPYGRGPGRVRAEEREFGLPGGVRVRHPVAADHARVQVGLAEWWGGLGGEEGAVQRRLLVPRLYFQHFTGTGFVAEDTEGRLCAFLVGFLSQSEPETAYIHFVGVRPEEQRSGLGSGLYRAFFALAREHGRTRVRCITSPSNRDSLAFHARMGFRVEPGGLDVDGVPAHADYDGEGLDRVSFVHDL